MRIFSFGGGVQSMAALVLAAVGELSFDAFVFANVGEDSEYPGTLEYFRRYAQPYAKQHGIELAEVWKTKGGQRETLYERIASARRSIPLPMRMNTTGAPGRRTCTSDFKIRVIARWLSLRGATEAEPAIVSLGISLDEYQRMRANSGIPWETLDYPLVDRRITREQCKVIIASAGLPVPPKSSCWFCPYHRVGEWRRLKREEPELFDKAAAVERLLNVRRSALGKDPVWMSYYRRPLDLAFAGETLQPALFETEICESGYCMV